MTVTDAQVNTALNIWNSVQGTDRAVLRQILEDFESAEIARLTLERDHAEAMCQEWITRAETAESSMEGADQTTADLLKQAERDRYLKDYGDIAVAAQERGLSHKEAMIEATTTLAAQGRTLI